MAEHEDRGEDRFCIYIEPPLIKKLYIFSMTFLIAAFVYFNKGAILTRLFGDVDSSRDIAGGIRLDESKFKDYGDERY